MKFLKRNKNVKIVAKFKGNENDSGTKAFGFRKGEKYHLKFRIGYLYERLFFGWDIVIEKDEGKFCTYSSLRSFLENWKITNQKDFKIK